MSEIKFEIVAPKEADFCKEIKFNYEQLKAEAQQYVEKYKGMTYTPEQIKAAKQDVAELRKKRDEIEAKRISVKKMWLLPYDVFEKKIKDVISFIEAPIMSISKQVSEFETKEKETKKVNIQKYYEALADDILSLLPFEKVFNEKWLNKTCKDNDVRAEIDGIVEKFNKDYAVIKSLNSEFENQILDKYIATFDITTALSEKARLEELKVKRTAFESKVVPEKTTPKNPTPTVVDAMNVYTPPKPTEKIYTLSLQVHGTQEQLQKLRAYLTEKNIGFEKVQKGA